MKLLNHICKQDSIINNRYKSEYCLKEFIGWLHLGASCSNNCLNSPVFFSNSQHHRLKSNIKLSYLHVDNSKLKLL